MNVVLTCLHLVHQETFNSVHHIFLVPGHYYMPYDRQFGSAEVKLRRHANIFTKHDYVLLIKEAVQGGFDVVEKTCNDFLDVWALQNCMTKSTAKGTTFTEARVLKFDSDYIEGYTIQDDYTDDSRTHNVRLQTGRRQGYSQAGFDLSTVSLQPK